MTKESEYFAGGLNERISCGELLPDGGILDLVNDEGRIIFCHWDGTEADLMPNFSADGIVYRPPQLHASACEAVRFPKAVGEGDTASNLFRNISQLFEHCAMDTQTAHFTSGLGIHSWFPELSPNGRRRTFLFYGSDVEQAVHLFRLLSCVFRRALVVPELTRSLPLDIRPSLFILSPELSAKQIAFWIVANQAGVYVPSHRGAFDNLACTLVMFTDKEELVQAWGPGICRFRLPAASGIREMNEQELIEIADEYQPKLLRLRLEYLSKWRTAASTEKGRCSTGALEKFLPSLRDEPEIVSSIRPVLEAQEEEFRECEQRDVSRAIVESIWVPSHESKEISMIEVTKRLNAILHARGETLDTSTKAVGWRMSDLGLPRVRNGKGMWLRFSRDICVQIHRLANNFSLELPKVDGCPDCNAGT